MAKEVEEFCAICGELVKMPVVQEDGEEPGFLWVQCPKCHEIKPLEPRLEGELEGELIPAAKEMARPASRMTLRPVRPGEPAPVGAGSEAIRTYVPGEEYEPGDLIYHQGWNDTGKVVGKKESGGGRRMILVEFEKMGKRKLVMEAERRK